MPAETSAAASESDTFDPLASSAAIFTDVVPVAVVVGLLEVGETKAEVPYWAANGIVLLIVLGALRSARTSRRSSRR